MNQKQQVLLPTLKERQRYVVYVVDFASVTSQIHRSILDQCIALLGIFDGAKAGLQLIQHEGSYGMIRVTSTHVDKLKVCLGMISMVDSKTITVRCVIVSGMIDKAAQHMHLPITTSPHSSSSKLLNTLTNTLTKKTDNKNDV